MALLTTTTSAAEATPSCPTPLVKAPAHQETVATARPIIQWKEVPGVASYRLTLSSRKPEGGVIASIDTTVSGTAFVPPAPLATSTAKVIWSVAAICGETAANTSRSEASHHFYIDLRPTCRMPDAPRIESVNGQRLVNWGKATAADRYEVFGYAAFDGKLQFAGETHEPPFALPDLAKAPMAIAVRPRCGAVEGAPAFVLN